jgi:hypothetical protein
MTLPIVTLLAAVAVTACSRPEGPSLPVAIPAPVSLDQFQTLHWLEGTWRGTGPAVNPFYESYRYLNDSTIRSFNYPDSTFAEARDSGTIAWRSGQVTSGDSGVSWVATRFDSLSLRFDPQRGATNSFTWTLESPTQWTALLEWRDSTGAERQRTYQMERSGH